MTIKTAKTLRFSSRFSVETFQLLDFLFKAQARSAILQQYQARSPHFHDKKGDEHIKKMIEESLGSFFLFERWLPRKVKCQLQQVYDDLDLEFMPPVVYLSLQDLYIGRDEAFVSQFELLEKEDSRETDRLPAVVAAYASVWCAIGKGTLARLKYTSEPCQVVLAAINAIQP